METAQRFFQSFYKRKMNRSGGAHVKLMVRLLHHFHVNEEEFQFIQIAGSCGKGSTAHIVSSILTANQIPHGLFTGPHLYRYQERFIVNGKMISAAELEDIAALIEQGLKSFEDADQVGHMMIMILTALLWFQQNQCKLIVFENGVGGKSDPSHFINPFISIITEITTDHEQLLGSHIEAITADKAGIIKPSAKAVVLGMRNEIARSYLNQSEKTQPQYFVDSDFRGEILNMTATYTSFNYFGPSKTWKQLRLPLRGEHQVQNAVTALMAVECLISLGFELKEAMIRSGLESMVLPARFQVIERDQKVIIVDGAHNALELRTFKQALSDYAAVPQTVVLSFSSSKNINEMVKAFIFKEAKYFVVHSPFVERRAKSTDIHAAFDEAGVAWSEWHDAEEAFAEAFKSTSTGGILAVTGSFYLIGNLQNLQGED